MIAVHLEDLLSARAKRCASCRRTGRLDHHMARSWALRAAPGAGLQRRKAGILGLTPRLARELARRARSA